MNTQTLDIIIKVVVGVATSLITGFIIPAIVRWISTLKDTKIFNYIKKVVNAAEQLYGPETGKIKKEYVTEIVKKAFGHVLSDEQINALIESAVYHISQEIKKSKTKDTEENVLKANSELVKEEKTTTKVIEG